MHFVRLLNLLRSPKPHPNRSASSRITMMAATSSNFAASTIDLGETKSVADANPELVRELNSLATKFLADTEAVVPIRNP